MLSQRPTFYALLALACLVIPTWLIALLISIAFPYLFFSGPKLSRNTSKDYRKQRRWFILLWRRPGSETCPRFFGFSA